MVNINVIWSVPLLALVCGGRVRLRENNFGYESVARDFFALCWREKYQDSQFFSDVVKPVLNFGGYKNNAARCYLVIGSSRLHSRSAAHDVIHLVLSVRFLWVGSSNCEHVH